MDRRERLEARLREAFAPIALEIVDDSERHRMVYDALAGELREEIHALEIAARSPEEPAR